MAFSLPARLPAPSLLSSLIPLALLAAAPLCAQGFINFETMGVQPIRLSPSGNLLACAHPADNQILIYTLVRPDRPVLIKEIQVGTEPVSVHPRTEDEIWVVNKVGDSISVVSLAAGRVMRTIDVGDEPADVVFAGKPLRAFVSVAGENEVQVFDVLSYKRLARIKVFGRAPKALATSADNKRVYVAAFLSGNHTTILSADKAPKPPKPTNPKLGPAPQTGLIVLDSDPKYSKILGAPLADEDVFEIDAQTLKVLRSFGGIGTFSCSTCHPGGETDGLAWDLGNPGGNMGSVKDPTNNKVYPLHPMKGPMTSQTIRGLAKSAPFHWRGDNATLHGFNGAIQPHGRAKDLDSRPRPRSCAAPARKGPRAQGARPLCAGPAKKGRLSDPACPSGQHHGEMSRSLSEEGLEGPMPVQSALFG